MGILFAYFFLKIILNLLEVNSYKCNRKHQRYYIIFPSISMLFYYISMHDTRLKKNDTYFFCIFYHAYTHILGKFLCTSLINSSFDNVLSFKIFLTLLWYFLSPHFSFVLCNKYSVVISEVHYKSIIFLEFIQNLYDDPIKIYDNMNIF